MRNSASGAWARLFSDHRFVFLTGDLGFMALESLRDAMGNRFINAGVAEQNMVSVAAGMAKVGIEAWVYSIAPFVYARPFEQIRNDVCLNNLPVKLVGNGGGYGYGSMGPSHHAIEDYGVLLTLQRMTVFVPAFAEDVEPAIRVMSASTNPAYLRLGRCEKPAGFVVPTFAPWRCLLPGSGAILVGVGPLIGTLLQRVGEMDVATRPSIWVLTQMPLGLTEIPAEVVARVGAGCTFTVLEEHVAHGSAGQALVARLAQLGVTPKRFVHFYAGGYPSGKYGSQTFHRLESGIDASTILNLLNVQEVHE